MSNILNIKKTNKIGVIILTVIIGIVAVLGVLPEQEVGSVNAEPQSVNLVIMQEQRLNEVNNKLMDLEIEENIIKEYKDCVESNLDWEEICQITK